MAASTEFSLKLQYHGRSISLPSRLHPNIKIESELDKLKAWKTSPSSSALSISETRSSSETIQHCLIGLAEVYNCVEDLLQSPATRKALLQYQQGALVEDALNVSDELLELCSNIRDFYSTMKEQVQDIQSTLRRKGANLSIEGNLNAYICTRKKMMKNIDKNLKAVKKIEGKISEFYSDVSDVDYGLFNVVRVLQEESTITLSVFKSLLSFLSLSAEKTKSVGWSLASKLMLTRSSSSTAAAASSGKYQNIMNRNEVGNVDLTIQSLHGCLKNKLEAMVELRTAQKTLQAVDASIEGLEAGLESLFRGLIRSRVSLLNILGH